jgi:hypothetical protein
LLFNIKKARTKQRAKSAAKQNILPRQEKDIYSSQQDEQKITLLPQRGLFLKVKMHGLLSVHFLLYFQKASSFL